MTAGEQKPITRRDFGVAALAASATSLIGARARADTTRTIDSHTHTFVRGLPVAADARYIPDYDASYERLLATSARNGVQRVVVAQPSFLGHDNSYLLRALAANPKKLRGVPWIEPRTSSAQWEQMGRLGVVGLRFPIYGLPTPEWADYRETFAEARRRGWHLHLYVESQRLPQILPIFLETGANVVIPHMGMFNAKPGPKQDFGFQHLIESASTGRVYVILSGSYRVGAEGAHEAAPILLDAFGPDRLLWGSDWPHTNTTLDRVTTYPQMLQDLLGWVSDPAVRNRILADNPARLFRF